MVFDPFSVSYHTTTELSGRSQIKSPVRPKRLILQVVSRSLPSSVSPGTLFTSYLTLIKLPYKNMGCVHRCVRRETSGLVSNTLFHDTKGRLNHIRRTTYS